MLVLHGKSTVLAKLLLAGLLAVVSTSPQGLIAVFEGSGGGEIEQSGLLLHYDFREGDDDQIVYDRKDGGGEDGQRGTTSGVDADDFDIITSPAPGGAFVNSHDVAEGGATTDLTGDAAFTIQILFETDTTGFEMLWNYGTNTGNNAFYVAQTTDRAVVVEYWGTSATSSTNYLSAIDTPMLLTVRKSASARACTVSLNRNASEITLTPGSDLNLVSGGNDIGDSLTGGSDLNGNVYDFALYDRSITDAEVTGNYDFWDADKPGLSLP